ncbi:alpha/beta fold hydrolase [Thalassolituus sp. LLYu03]|uniref:alpha/beta fold hydrolase n=1 Tax=Thalassolituus sp. LLYu03 TaxID=3421656 RepID=UPI003D2E52A7
MINGTEREWKVRYGTLRGQQFGQPLGEAEHLILALHGWLDNSATFQRLAPLLTNCTVLAVDLPGHGASDWLAEGGDYAIWSAVEPVFDLCEQLAGPVHLLGHSMGGAVGTLLAGAFPELVRSLIALDVAGPLATAPVQVAAQLAQSVRFKPSGRQILYPTPEAAIAARVGHNPELSADCIAPVVLRNLKQVDEQWGWCTDSRLRAPSRVRLTEEQIAGFLSKMTMPSLFVRAQGGLIPESLFRQRLAQIPAARYCELAGHHHLHLEPSTVPSVAHTINDFLESLT